MDEVVYAQSEVSTSFYGRLLYDKTEFMVRLCLPQYLYGDSDRQVVENARINLVLSCTSSRYNMGKNELPRTLIPLHLLDSRSSLE